MTLFSATGDTAGIPEQIAAFLRTAAGVLTQAGAGTFRLFAAAGKGLRRWWINRTAAQLLGAADGAVLRDLGIARGDVERVVRDGRR